MKNIFLSLIASTIAASSITTSSNNLNGAATNAPTTEILQRNIDNFQQLSPGIYLTGEKSQGYHNQELYLLNVNNHKTIDLNLQTLGMSSWVIGNNRFIATDGQGNSDLYDVTNPQNIIKVPLLFVPGTAILYAQKITNDLYLVSFPDQDAKIACAVVNFSDINDIKYTILPNFPWITNGNPAFILNDHSFIITVTATSDWVYCDISDFNHPMLQPLFGDREIVLSSVNSLSDEQVLITWNNIETNELQTQLWTMNNSNPDLWTKQTINNIIINDFIRIQPNLAIVSDARQSGLALLNYTNWENLVIRTIPNSQNVEMLDYITHFPTKDIIFGNQKLIFNDFTNNEIKSLDFSNLNDITITASNIFLSSYFSGLYQINKVNDQSFVTLDNQQNFDLITWK